MSNFTDPTSTSAATPVVSKRLFLIYHGYEFMLIVTAEFIQYNGSTVILKNRNDHIVAVLTEGYSVFEDGNILK